MFTPNPIYVNDTQIRYANAAKYLALTLDTKILWNKHIKMKQVELRLILDKCIGF